MRYVVSILFLASPALAGEPAQKPLVVTVQRPTVVMQQCSPPTRLRGPLRVRAATVMANVVTDTTMRIVEEIPGAILDSILKGRFELKGKIEVK